ncbi:MAG: hypothetical protein EHM59_21085, partial [Betaproteobacteria bacterium]
MQRTQVQDNLMCCHRTGRVAPHRSDRWLSRDAGALQVVRFGGPFCDRRALPNGFYTRRCLMNHSKRGMVRVVSAISVIMGLTLAGGTAGWAQQKSLKEQLVGAWTLVSIEVTSKDGAKRPGFGGPNAKGILILDASGRYAQVTGNPDRPKLTTTVRSQIPAAELGEAARTFGARFGA